MNIEKNSEPITLVWFRRDLRLHDNAALYYALKENKNVLPLFIFDETILQHLEKSDARLTFIYDCIQNMQEILQKKSSDILVVHGKPIEVFSKILNEYSIKNVYTNEDYEPYATERDKSVENLLKENGISFHASKDQVIFSKNEIVKADGEPYVVFTPYSKVWRATLNDFYLSSYPVKEYEENFYKTQAPFTNKPTLESLGFTRSTQYIPPAAVKDELINHYAEQRDYPSLEATSRLGIHLRFGTISIRELVCHAKELSFVFVSELIWRDFYQSILWHYPKVGKGQSFRAAYDNIPWEKNEDHFTAWCEGKTGYPLVDAGMRQLNETGFMHNRIRMVTASFLAKHLLLDWRLGEAYFAQKLLDFDLAANNGGWQWSSGSGVDAAPYFRVFNPELQAKRFDSQNKYIKKWVPEFGTAAYPQPVVDHKFARERVIERYKKALNEQK